MLSYAEQLKAQQSFSDRLRSIRTSVGADLSRLALHLQKYQQVLSESDAFHSQQIRQYNRSLAGCVGHEVDCLMSFYELMKGAPEFQENAQAKDLIRLTKTQHQEIQQTQNRNATLVSQACAMEGAKIRRFKTYQIEILDASIKHAAQQIQRLTELSSQARRLCEDSELQELRNRFDGVDIGGYQFPLPVCVVPQTSANVQPQQRPQSAKPIARVTGTQTLENVYTENNDQPTKPQITEAGPKGETSTLNAAQEPQTAQYCKVQLIDESAPDTITTRVMTANTRNQMRYQLLETDDKPKTDFSQQAELSRACEIDELQREYKQIKEQLMSSGIL